MKKTTFALIIALFPFMSYADYEMEKWSLEFTNKFNLNTDNLWSEVSREDFVNSLYEWYDDYKRERWVIIDYLKYKEIDNSIYFKDIDLSSDFWKKLSYFSHIWAFSRNENFNPNDKINQKTYFIIMNRLWIMYSLENCKTLKICEREATKTTPFLKWTYYKYTSKIMDKSLRKYYNSPQSYIEAWYKPFLKPSYKFPLLKQTLNGCYAYTIRNILKYKHWIWVYVQRWEKYIGKKPEDLWYYSNMAKFDKIAHVTKEKAYNIDTLITSLHAWEPVSISYILKYKNWKWETKTVGHIVAAYSFDEKWVWVSETVANKRIRIAWEELFNSYWTVRYFRIFRYTYNPKENWTEKELAIEKQYNFLHQEK